MASPKPHRRSADANAGTAASRGTLALGEAVLPSPTPDADLVDQLQQQLRQKDQQLQQKGHQIDQLRLENQALRQRLSEAQQQGSGFGSAADLPTTQQLERWSQQQQAEFKIRDKLTVHTQLQAACREGSTKMMIGVFLSAALSGALQLQPCTVMHGAAQGGQLWLCRWIVDFSGIHQARATNNFGDTPLHWASGQGHLAVVRWLVEQGAADDQVNKPNNKGWTPFHLACLGGHLGTTQWLFKNGAADMVTTSINNGDTPLHLTCRDGQAAMIPWLLEHGAAHQVFSANSNGNTPLHLAAFAGHLELVKLLLERARGGQLLDMVNNSGDTPLFLACWQGHLAVAQWLVEQGAAQQLYRTTKHGDTPLHLACRGGHLAVVQWLDRQGAARQVVASPNNFGDTPLHWACRGGSPAVAQWLFDHGAADQVASPDKDGNTPMAVACAKDQRLACRWLLSVGGPAVLDHDAVCAHMEQPSNRDALVALINDSLALHARFKRVALFGMSRRSGSPWLSKLQGEVGLRMLVAAFLGVPTGQAAGNLRGGRAVLQAMAPT